jgi:hypothetical protein
MCITCRRQQWAEQEIAAVKDTNRWVLVPKIPTTKMVLEGVGAGSAADVWRAMINAVPTEVRTVTPSDQDIEESLRDFFSVAHAGSEERMAAVLAFDRLRVAQRTPLAHAPATVGHQDHQLLERVSEVLRWLAEPASTDPHDQYPVSAEQEQWSSDAAALLALSRRLKEKKL